MTETSSTPSAGGLAIQLLLIDPSPEVAAAWRDQFRERPEVTIEAKSIFDASADACVCPGNGFGFMDGGLALRMCERFGFEIQDRIRETVRVKHDGEMLVGQAVLIETGKSPPWMVYAATMRTPGPVAGTLNAYLAMRGALIAVRDHNRADPARAIRSLSVPGLCTGTGGMHPLISARQIRYAYEQAIGARKLGDRNLSQLSRRENKLRSLPASAAALEDPSED